MKKLLYLLTGLVLTAGVFTGCEKPEKESEKAKSTIKGVVTDKETGSPLSGVIITLQPTGKQVQTAEDGTYIFENLKVGSYTLQAQKDGYDDYENAEIKLGVEQTLVLDIEMGESICALEGKVTDKKTGEPLSGVTIEIQLIGKQVQTAENGIYRLDSLKAGTYTLKAQKAGYVDYIKEKIKLIASQTLPLDIEMEEEYKAESDYTVTMYGLNLEMVYVEGGEFEMGATAEQGNDAYDDEKPVRTIKLDGYHIGKYEVTQAQWKAVMGTEPSYYKGDNLPVEKVSWEEAQEFCRKLSRATGKKYGLPTEAQWEYAARGGNKSQHYKYAGGNDIDEVAWYRDGHSGSKTHPVGSKKANELGLYDMSGNVWEWCSDWYGNYDENDTENPQRSANDSRRVNRGGGWDFPAVSCRVSNRDGNTPDERYGDLGFRVACSSK
ncbi:MAG: SUMF1/EgtB/PvdO family nonheme iron enzyme [Bacteroidales bacterium]|nr:SUMF1/EgtB/PvdO family nonheme iron enzyme [Bacteroidales bacterium]